jgi:multidrug efflux pump subunit AcrA (membrane-fusion protein)
MSFQAIGNVEPYATVAIKARVDGQEVAKGQPLFQIDPRSRRGAALSNFLAN